MLNSEFKIAQRLLADKVTMQILKVTRTFLSSCECGRKLTAYCVARARCKACELDYIVASLWKETIVIGGETQDVIALAGRCPRCHRKNISRAGSVPCCSACRKPSGVVGLPIKESALISIPPQILVSSVDLEKQFITLSWGNIDLPTLRCKAKYIN